MCDGEQCCGSTFVLCRSESSKKNLQADPDGCTECTKAVKAEGTFQILIFFHWKKLISNCLFICLEHTCRWECLLKQLLSITVNRLPTKKNKLPFSVSVYDKQTEVCRFYFPFAGAIAPPPPTITLRYIYALSRNASSLLKRVVASVNYHSRNIEIAITF
jgi:hypothetical protein